MSRLAGVAGRVWAVEPNPQLTGLLTENISAAGLPNVTVIAHAAGATHGTTLLWLNETNFGDSRVFDPRLTNGGGDYQAHGFPLEPKAVTVEVRTIDAILDGSRLDVALIDTQGWDHEVLRGMRKTLERDHPWVLTEFVPSWVRDLDEDPVRVLEEYRSWGYVLGSPDLTLPPDPTPDQILSAIDASKSWYANIELMPRGHRERASHQGRERRDADSRQAGLRAKVLMPALRHSDRLYRSAKNLERVLRRVGGVKAHDPGDTDAVSEPELRRVDAPQNTPPNAPQNELVGTERGTEEVERMHLQTALHAETDRLRDGLRRREPDNPAGRGFKVYSQFDEDGILADILGRLRITVGTFVEIGCGDGTENNTHLLLLQGWRGMWIDGDPENIQRIRAVLPVRQTRLDLRHEVVTRENVVDLVAEGLARLDVSQARFDVLSVDIDGNDVAVTVPLLRRFRPKVVVVEYNAKFPWPLVVTLPYNPDHIWLGDDAFGASLAAWAEAIGGDFQLVCCGLSGVNAFYVRADLAGSFVLSDPATLYQPARYHLTALTSGHSASLRFLAAALARIHRTEPPERPARP
jgi:FkbM family methyltransferase